MSIPNRIPFSSWQLLALWAVIAMCLVPACVDTTRPWDKVKAVGTGGIGAGGVGGQVLDGALPIDSAWEIGSGGAMDVGVALGGAGGGIDVAEAGGDFDVAGAGGGIDAAGAGGDFDTSISGTGGIVGTGGSILDGPVVATGGALGNIDGGSDVPLGGTGGGTGGTAMTGGVPGTGGTSRTGGASGTGGVTGTGGAGTGGVIGTGGTSTPGLLAYYKCDETTGSTLSDSSGNGNHGTLYGSYSFGKGKVGNALTLVGSGNGYASLPTKVFAGLHNITVATWVYVTTSHDWQRVFDTGINAGSDSALASGAKYMNLVPKNAGSDLRLSITVDGFNSEESLHTPSPSTGVWTHVAIVLDEAQGYGWLYIDGSYKYGDATAIQPDNLGAIDYAWIGRSQFRNDPYFDGMIDEFRVYDRALSADEIDALYKLTGP